MNESTPRFAVRIFDALLGAFLTACVTGVAILPAYHSDQPNQSIRAFPPVLAWMREVHHWASALCLILLGLLALLVLASGSAQRFGKRRWLTALGIGGLGLLLQLTGHLLPGDPQGIQTAAIEIGIGSNAFGGWITPLLAGPGGVGPSTFGYWFALHLALPALALLPLILGRKTLSPKQDFLKVLAAVAAGLALFALVAPTPLGPAATAADWASFDARPEWYTAPLHTLLGLSLKISPSASILGVAIVPGLATMVLALAPRIKNRRAQVGLGAAFGLGVATLTLMSANQMNSPFVTPSFAKTGSTTASALDPKDVAKGKDLYAKQQCASCHKMDGVGGKSGPDLSHEGARQGSIDWQILHLKGPDKVHPGSTMPDYADLSEADLRALASFVASKK